MSYTHFTYHSYVGAIMAHITLLVMMEIMCVPMALMNRTVEREETRDLCFSTM